MIDTVARFLVFLTGRRVLLVAVTALAAALNARGLGVFHTNGFFDGPH